MITSVTPIKCCTCSEAESYCTGLSKTPRLELRAIPAWPVATVVGWCLEKQRCFFALACSSLVCNEICPMLDVVEFKYEMTF